jgi:hypothetical protein
LARAVAHRRSWRSSLGQPPGNVRWPWRWDACTRRLRIDPRPRLAQPLRTNRTYISHLLIGDSLRCQPRWCVDPLKPPRYRTADGGLLASHAGTE